MAEYGMLIVEIRSNMKKLQEKWIWLHEDNKDYLSKIENSIERLNYAGINNVFYKGKKVDEAADLYTASGIKFHAWTWMLNCNDEEIVEEHPDWYSINREGISCLEKQPYVNYYKWLCPSKQEVKDYLAEKVSRLCDIDNVESVHLDYIRYCDVILPEGLQPKYNLIQDSVFPEYDFCYCQSCRDEFLKRTGSDIYDMDSDFDKTLWVQYRYDSVVELVNFLCDIIHSKGKRVTAAVFPTPQMSREMVRQDWDKWNIDKAFPMQYYVFYNRKADWLIETAGACARDLKDKFPFVSGLYIPESSIDELKEAVEYAIANGAESVSFFDYGSLTEKHFDMIKEL